MIQNSGRNHQSGMYHIQWSYQSVRHTGSTGRTMSGTLVTETVQPPVPSVTGDSSFPATYESMKGRLLI